MICDLSEQEGDKTEKRQLQATTIGTEGDKNDTESKNETMTHCHIKKEF